MGMWYLSCLVLGHLASNTCPEHTLLYTKAHLILVRNQIGPKWLHGWMHTRTSQIVV